MIEEGDSAPRFELPAIRDGEFDRVALDEFVGQDVVILVFYPGDFNPAGPEGATDLDEFDLLTMQKDVSILAISGDSTFSHRAFADEFDLHIPLLSDVRGEVASEYGVAVDDDVGYLARRAVFVIDPTETVEYAWAADDVDSLPDVDEIRTTVEGVEGDETARARYRVGNAHYVEGRRAFTLAMNAYEDKDWMMARGDFAQAAAGFDEARDEFDTAARFAEDEEERKYFERAEEKAEALWRAADWLSDSANEFASGEGAQAEALRRDAETPLETARDIHEPPPPDDFPPEEDPAETGDDEDEDEEHAFLPSDETEVDATLELDLDFGEETAKDETTAKDDSPETGGGDEGGIGEPATADGRANPTDGVRPTGGVDASGEASADDPDTREATDESRSPPSGTEPADGAATGDAGAGTGIDDAELEEITAELEQQSESAREGPASGEESGNAVPDSIDHRESNRSVEGDGVDDRGGDGDLAGNQGAQSEGTGDDRPPDADGETDVENIEGELDEDDIELDLTDPTDEDEERDDPDDPGSGNHGVSDSL
jgi:peroxiredoxin